LVDSLKALDPRRPIREADRDRRDLARRDPAGVGAALAGGVLCFENRRQRFAAQRSICRSV